MTGRRRTKQAIASDASVRSSASVTREEIARRFMLPLIVPLWISAGLACMSMAPESFTLSPFDDRRCTLTFRGIAENCAGAAIALDRFIRS
jgi:hypothetical protein